MTMSTVNEIATSVGVPVHQLDKACTDKQLITISKLIPNLHQYSVALELTEQEINAIETNPNLTYPLRILECLRTWNRKNSHSPRGTLRHLMQTCINEHNAKLAGDVCKILLQKEESQTVEVEKVVDLRLSAYKDYLRGRYQAQASTSSTQWPPVPITKVFKLAMIKKEKIQMGRIDDKFVRLSITGKVDDILHIKTEVALKNIFSETENGRKVILIEGAPGSGKSTLSLHICQEWGKGELFQQYDVVILVRLRDPHVQKAITLADLLPRVNKAMAEQAEAAMISNNGQGVLWVLDGWDELPSNFPTDSIIHKLVQPGKFRESPLHQSDVIVTSRPVSSGKLHPVVSTRVEVLGFTPDELKLYFTDCLNGDSKAVQSLLDRIRENPVVEGSCYLPLNAAIVAHVYLAGDHTLPSSNHGIFTSVVRFSLSRYLQNRLGRTPDEAIVTSLETLPPDLCNLFDQLCTLAFFGVMHDKVTFVVDDLRSAHVTIKVSEVGLLQAVPSILVDNREVYYCFLHLSIQELLAAVYISHMTPSEQISVFQKMFGEPRFNAVFQFYAGITKFKACRWFLSKLPRFVFPNTPRGVLDLVSNIIQQRSKLDFVSLLHCLHEADDPFVCQFVYNLIRKELNLSCMVLSPLACLSLGNFLSLVNTADLSIDLSYCSIGDLECKFLTRGLFKCLNTDSMGTIQFELEYNNIHEEGAGHIGHFLRNTAIVRKLNLSGNGIGGSGLKSLCEGLTTNTSLSVLYMRNCSMQVSDDNGPMLCEMLSTNCCLKVLSLTGNPIRADGLKFLCHGLLTNTSLTDLYVIKCSIDNISEESGSALAKMLSENCTLTTFSLFQNSIGEDGLTYICKGLSRNTALIELNLSACSVSISEANGPPLISALRNNRTLEVLNLSDNSELSDSGCDYITTALKDNASLRVLQLNNCNLTNRGVENLCVGINNTYIEELYLHGNRRLHTAGVRKLADNLTTQARLRVLSLPLYSDTVPDRYSADCVLKETVNIERKRNRLPTINFISW